MIKLLILRLVWYLCSALQSSPYFGSHLPGTSNNYTFYFFSHEKQAMGQMSSYIFPLSSRLITIAPDYFQYPWEVETNVFLLLCLLNAFQVLLRVK